MLLSRRSRRHPGTRYLARGLNEHAGPGNEIECELVIWTRPSVANEQVAAIRWARCVWRRGTVPIWWGVHLRSIQKGLAADTYVREHSPYHGTASYFKRYIYRLTLAHIGTYCLFLYLQHSATARHAAFDQNCS